MDEWKSSRFFCFLEGILKEILNQKTNSSSSVRVTFVLQTFRDKYDSSTGKAKLVLGL